MSEREAQVTEVTAVIRAIVQHGRSRYYIAKLMRRQVVQVQRMERSGRCQPHELAMLREILADCEGLQNVTIKSGEDGRTGV